MEMRVKHVLEHVEAADVMEADPVRIPVGTTIADASMTTCYATTTTRLALRMPDA
jgi:hypothetical protein